MSDVLSLQTRLRETAEVIARTEKALALNPTRSLELSLRSLYKINSQYEEQFHAAAGAEMADVFSYRLFEGSGQPLVSLVGRALDSFQSLYSVVFASVSGRRPVDSAHISTKFLLESSFQFAYSFSGSTGFVFTLPNQRLLFGETNLDEAMEQLFVLTRCQTSEEIKDFAIRVGLAPIRAAYKWAAALALGHVGAELIWRKNDEQKSSVILQPSEILALKALIDATSAEEIDENYINGRLVGFDRETQRFRLTPDDGTSSISGSFGDSADIPAQVKIPGDYLALLKSTTRVRYATEKTESTHYLLSLSEVNAQPEPQKPVQ